MSHNRHPTSAESDYGYYQCPKCKTTLLVEYPKSRVLKAARVKPSPRTKAGLNRTIKTIFFYILGFALAIAAFAVVGLLSEGDSIPDWLVQVTGLGIAGISAGLYKAINWKDTGVDVSLLPAPTASPSLPTLTAPSPVSEDKEEENVDG